jgi:hypothetical protein
MSVLGWGVDVHGIASEDEKGNEYEDFRHRITYG